jgi:hypothetical protein
MSPNANDDHGEFPTAFFLTWIKNRLMLIVVVIVLAPAGICVGVASDTYSTSLRWLCIAGAVFYGAAFAATALWFDDRKRKKAAGK